MGQDSERVHLGDRDYDFPHRRNESLEPSSPPMAQTLRAEPARNTRKEAGRIRKHVYIYRECILARFPSILLHHVLLRSNSCGSVKGFLQG